MSSFCFSLRIIWPCPSITKFGPCCSCVYLHLLTSTSCLLYLVVPALLFPVFCTLLIQAFHLMLRVPAVHALSRSSSLLFHFFHLMYHSVYLFLEFTRCGFFTFTSCSSYSWLFLLAISCRPSLVVSIPPPHAVYTLLFL
jgi:hypothetical protein